MCSALISSVARRGNTTQFSYDARNRLSSKTDPLNKVESYAYDAIGNRIRTTDRKGQVSGYAFDSLNRLTSAGFGGTTSSPTSFLSTVTYTWDAGNRLTGAVDSVSGVITRDFDGLDRLLEEQSPQGRINYTYYANGLRQTMTVQGQSSVSYAYDNVDRLTQISQNSATVGLDYDAIDRRTTLTLPSGIVVTYGYDDAGQVTSLAYQNGSTLVGDLTYSYDAAGRRVSMGGSLAQVNLPAAIETMTHDAPNRLRTWGAHAFGYDDNGALTSDANSPPLTYVWDERQRLKQIQQGSSTLATFQYDAFNRRIGKTVNGVGWNYLNDGWQVVQELSGTTPAANLLTGLRVDEIFRRTAGTDSGDFLTDALGSTIALTDAAGMIQTTYVYDPYGGGIVNGTASDNPYQYTGRENDGELYHYRNRYYSPTLHRFTSEDPIGFAGGSNLYSYVHGNPISFGDPYGNSAAVVGVGAGLVGLYVLCEASGACDRLRDGLGDWSEPSSPGWKPWGPFPNPDAPGDDTWQNDPNGSGDSERARRCRAMCSVTSLPGEANFRNCLRRCMKNPPFECE